MLLCWSAYRNATGGSATIQLLTLTTVCSLRSNLNDQSRREDHYTYQQQYLSKPHHTHDAGHDLRAQPPINCAYCVWQPRLRVLYRTKCFLSPYVMSSEKCTCKLCDVFTAVGQNGVMLGQFCMGNIYCNAQIYVRKPCHKNKCTTWRFNDFHMITYLRHEN